MNSTFELKVATENNQKVVDFANNTPNFVEVVLNIDGNLVKGYCYPPFHHKPIRRQRTGEALPLGEHGRIQAYVYSGIGQYKSGDVDYDIPPIIRFKLNQDRFKKIRLTTDNLLQRRANQKVSFKRLSNNPVEVLEIPY